MDLYDSIPEYHRQTGSSASYWAPDTLLVESGYQLGVYPLSLPIK